MALPLLMLLCADMVYAQYRVHHDRENLENNFQNRIGFFSGTSVVPTHIAHQISSEYTYVPTYGLEFGRSVTKWFGLAVHNEFELQHFVIVDEDENTDITRSNIYILTGLIYFIPIRHLGVYMGYGHEFTGSQGYEVYKVGMEYSIHINGGWDIAPEVCFDRVGNLFTTFTFGFTIGKSFNL